MYDLFISVNWSSLYVSIDVEAAGDYLYNTVYFGSYSSPLYSETELRLF